MPIIDPDQGTSLVDLADAANNQVAFANQYASLLSRMNLRYTDDANRALLHPANIDGEESYLTASNRKEVNNGTNWVSAHSAGLYTNAFRTTDAAAINNSTVLVSDGVLLSPLPTAGRFQFSFVVFYDGSAAGDFKVAFTWPVGATATWGAQGMATTGAASVGDGQFQALATSGTAVPFGAGGVGTPSLIIIGHGTINMGGTSGNLQMQYAQNTADPTNTIVRAGSRLQVWRV